MKIKEDLQAERFEKGQEIISEYFQKNGLIEAKQVIKSPVYLEEIIQSLLAKSKPHRQIAYLLGVSNSVVRRVSLNE